MTEDKNKNLDDELDNLLNELKGDNTKLTHTIGDASSDHGKLDELRQVLLETQNHVARALAFLGPHGISAKNETFEPEIKITKERKHELGAQRIVEGVFNGECMIGGDGKRYNIPANYASKSKLVEGDILKLTITKDGSFIYKQIGPIERRQLIATLGYDETSGEWYALQEGGRRWKLLTASVTYFRGEPGDEVVIIIPKNSASNWAGVENIIKV